MSAMSIADKNPRVVDEVAKYVKPPALGARTLLYGTAGFREDASLLPSTCHRMGILAVLRSKCEGKITGIMITASHNLGSDNGLKLIDPRGDMLKQSWEKYAVQLANASADKIVDILDEIITAEKINLDQTGNVFIAKDTRASSESLAELAREGALVVGGNVLDFGLQTTPQLHHLVRMWNYEQFNRGDWASEVGYYNMLTDAFKQLTAGIDAKKLEMRTPLYVDCAHGVGALQLAKLAKELGASLHLELFNTPSDGELNVGCGAEHVQKGRQPPTGVTIANDSSKRFCSIDGDGDRVVFHYVDDANTWHLLDGDKLACLFALYVSELLQTLDLGSQTGSSNKPVTLGVVQTAYANGAATQYLKSQHIPTAQAATGVKHCHAKAQAFDVGIYFEANGHGTILFKDALVDRLLALENQMTSSSSAGSSEKDARQRLALTQLLATQQLVNQATGDAMSDLLLAEVLLIHRNWSIREWDALYTDYPSRQTKVQVADRNAIEMDPEDETNVKAPAALVTAIHAAIASVKEKDDKTHARAFVRPSGTENVVRIYAEATTQDAADTLALQLATLVFEHVGGVGDAPTTFVA